MVGGVSFVGDAHKGRTRQLLDRALVPFDDCTLNLVLIENAENIGRSVTGVLGGGGVGMGGNPDDDRAQLLVPILVEGREASGLQCRVLNTALLEQSNDHRSDNMPDRVELRSEDSLGGLGRDLKEPGPRSRNREGIRIEIGTVEQLRRVHRDAMIVMGSFVFRNKVGGGEGSIRSDGNLREESRSIAQGGRGRIFQKVVEPTGSDTPT